MTKLSKTRAPRDFGLRIFHVIDRVKVDQERWNLACHTTHLADRIQSKRKLELLRFAPASCQRACKSIALRIELARFEIAFSVEAFCQMRGLPRFRRTNPQLIVIGFDSVETIRGERVVAQSLSRIITETHGACESAAIDPTDDSVFPRRQ